MFTVTGKMPAEEDVEQLIETGESETIFQKAILEQGRGQARFGRRLTLSFARREHGMGMNCSGECQTVSQSSECRPSVRFVLTD